MMDPVWKVPPLLEFLDSIQIFQSAGIISLFQRIIEKSPFQPVYPVSASSCNTQFIKTLRYKFIRLFLWDIETKLDRIGAKHVQCSSLWFLACVFTSRLWTVFQLGPLRAQGAGPRFIGKLWCRSYDYQYGKPTVTFLRRQMPISSIMDYRKKNVCQIRRQHFQYVGMF